ncbi:hypothetical protein GW758_03440 [Candidatus Falkowbacteria bacterium]|nr:hypothetical protein [Candidatus Falkowbacteria bacterium]NCT54981.1 hypothetical protein [Candidatus Falkowbacteria bacterium]
MNANQWIKNNWGAILLVIAVVVAGYFFFAPDRNTVRSDESQSFLTGDVTTGIHDLRVEDASASVGTSAPAATAVQAPQTGGAGEAIQWCVLLGANHIPDLFGEGIPNGGGGTNWHSGGADDPKGPHGVFNENGKMVFFVKKSYLDQNGASPMSAQLKSNVTGWNNPLPMTLSNVLGEQAFVYIKE